MHDVCTGSTACTSRRAVVAISRPLENDRETFTDSHWRNSCEYTLRLAVSLASCVAPFAEDAYLPLEHAEALSLVVRLSERCREVDKGGERAKGLPAGLHSSLKYCTKKNGLGKSASEVREGGRRLPVEERAESLAGVQEIYTNARRVFFSFLPQRESEEEAKIRCGMLAHWDNSLGWSTVVVRPAALFAPLAACLLALHALFLEEFWNIVFETLFGALLRLMCSVKKKLAAMNVGVVLHTPTMYVHTSLKCDLRRVSRLLLSRATGANQPVCCCNPRHVRKQNKTVHTTCTLCTVITKLHQRQPQQQQLTHHQTRRWRGISCPRTAASERGRRPSGAWSAA